MVGNLRKAGLKKEVKRGLKTQGGGWTKPKKHIYYIIILIHITFTLSTYHLIDFAKYETVFLVCLHWQRLFGACHCKISCEPFFVPEQSRVSSHGCWFIPTKLTSTFALYHNWYTTKKINLTVVYLLYIYIYKHHHMPTTLVVSLLILSSTWISHSCTQPFRTARSLRLWLQTPPPPTHRCDHSQHRPGVCEKYVVTISAWISWAFWSVLLIWSHIVFMLFGIFGSLFHFVFHLFLRGRFPRIGHGDRSAWTVAPSSWTPSSMRHGSDKWKGQVAPYKAIIYIYIYSITMYPVLS